MSFYNSILFTHLLQGIILFVLLLTATSVHAATQELIVNGGFEDGTTGWTLSGAVVTSGGNEHAGTRYAVLGEINSSTDLLSQIMTVPERAGLATASFYYYIYTEEAATDKYDTLDVDLINLTTGATFPIARLSNLDGGTCTSGSSCYQYLSKEIDLSGMDGDSIQIRFRSTMDSDTFTSFKIDDVSLLVNITDDEPSGSAPTTVTDNATNITSNSATLNGTVNPNGLSTEVNFLWRKPGQAANPTDLYQDIGDGTSPVSVSTDISGLEEDTQYEFQVYAVNSVSGSFGTWKTFTTSATTQPQCSDGIDNDGDGQTDYPNDPDCDSANEDSEQGFTAGTIDIEVSDSPDPFSPFEAEEDGNTITVSNIGTNNCNLTLTIESTGREWSHADLEAGTAMDFLWDGRNSSGSFVPAGTYTYTAECVQSRNNTAQTWWGRALAWFANTAHAFFSDTETGTITVLASGETPSPTCDLFTAIPPTIAPGESTTLTWESSHAVIASIDNGVGIVPVEGSVVVQPEQTTTYTVTFGGVEDVSCSVDVTVIGSENISLENLTVVEDDNVQDGKGVADKTNFTFSVATQGNPDEVTLVVDGISYDMTQNEDMWSITKTFPKGVHSWHFVATKGGQTVETEPQQISAGYSNVAFLPGIQASNLYTKEMNRLCATGAEPQKAWMPASNCAAKYLSMNSSGTSKYEVYTKEKDVIDEFLGFNVYKKFIKYMDDDMVGEGIIHAWKPLAYDWRLDFDELLKSGVVINDRIYYAGFERENPYIYEELEDLIESSDSGKVTIIAHSMGGIISKLMLERLAKEGHPYHRLYKKIDQLMLVASPQLGTPKAIEGLLHADKQQFGLGEWGFFLDEKTARELGENMQSAYNLLPSRKYFDRVASPVLSFNGSYFCGLTDLFTYGIKCRVPELAVRSGTSITEYNDMTTFLLGDNGSRTKPNPNNEEYPNVLDATLLDTATTLHDNDIDYWAPPVHMDVTQIVGWGKKTIKGIEYSCGLGTCYSIDSLDRDLQMTKEGDGTVVVPSADAMDVLTYYVNLKNYNAWGQGQRNRSHADILETEVVQTLISNSVQHINSFALPDFSSKTKPAQTDKEYELVLKSPVSIDVYDSNGNHTGLIDSPEESDLQYYEARIPNSYYIESAGHKYVGFGSDDTYDIKLQGEAVGSFTFEIKETQNDEIINTTTFKNIPVTEKTKGSFVVIEGRVEQELGLDVDGDGNVDAIFVEGEEAVSKNTQTFLKAYIESLDLKKNQKQILLRVLKNMERIYEHKRLPEKMKERLLNRFESIFVRTVKLYELRGLISEDEKDTLVTLFGQVKTSMLVRQNQL